MDVYPQIIEKDNSFVVKLGPAAETGRTLPIKMVLDFDADGKVVGIEIINLVLQAGNKALNYIKHTRQPTFGYDPDCDSFYMRVKNVNSTDQKSVSGALTLDDEGEIMGFTARWN